MIGNATTGTGFGGVISYVYKEKVKDLKEEEKPEFIASNQVFGSPKDMAKQMRYISKENEYVSRPVLHVSLSFSRDEKLNPEQAKKAIFSTLKELGVDEKLNQYVIVKHNDAKHEHYHAVINKVDLEGKNLDTSYIKNKLQVACDKVEKTQNLRRTEGRTVMYDPTNEKGYRFRTPEEKKVAAEKKLNNKVRDKSPKIEDKKNYIKENITQVLSDKSINNPDKFKKALESKAIETKFAENKNGIYGASYKHKNEVVKGTDIDYKYNKVKAKLEQNKEQHQEQFKPKSKPMEQDDTQFTQEYNQRITKVVNEHNSEFDKRNFNPNTDKIFAENGFAKENDKYIFEKDGHKAEVSKDTFELAKKQEQSEFNRESTEEKDYKNLMSQQPEKVPAFIGKSKAIENNKELLEKQKTTQKPVYVRKNKRIQSKDLQITSKTLTAKAKEEQEQKLKTEQNKNIDKNENQKQGFKI